MQMCRSFISVAGLAFSFTIILTGCSAITPWSNKGLSSGPTRIVPSDIARNEMTVSRSEFVKRLREQGTDGVRVIPILQGQSYEVASLPQHRIFEVKKGSVYELLGLQNADILVSAQGFIIRDPRVFPEYVSLLRNQPGAAIEIRREGRPLLLTVTFKD